MQTKHNKATDYYLVHDGKIANYGKGPGGEFECSPLLKYNQKTGKYKASTRRVNFHITSIDTEDGVTMPEIIRVVIEVVKRRDCRTVKIGQLKG